MKNGDRMNKLSAMGENPMIPEMTKKAQKNHGKHLRPGKSFSGMTMKDYVQNGRDFARSAVGDDIVGYRGTDGSIVRFNKATGEWVKAYATGVATYMKPMRGNQYYIDKMKDDGGVTHD